jgi:hypothetical protein
MPPRKKAEPATVEVTDETEILDPRNQPLTLESGIEIEINPLRTYELFALARIITSGAGPMLGQLNFNVPGDAFQTQLLAMLIFALPEADKETIEFLNRMCTPKDLDKSPKLSKKAKDANDELWAQMGSDLSNPLPEDLLTIIEAIIYAEAPHIQSLGKRLVQIVETVRKLSPLKARSVTTPNSQESSPDSTQQD